MELMGRICDLPVLERPREKAIRYGMDKLSDEELLTLIIASGYKGKSAKEIANDLLEKENGLFHLSQTSFSNLMKIDGISTITSLKIASIFEIYRRLNFRNIENNEQEIDEEYLFKKYQNIIGNQEKEYLVIVSLNKKKKIVHEKTIGPGDLKRISISIKDILKETISNKATYFYLLHNHPSGEVYPSVEDIDFTLKVVEKSKDLSLIMLDHLILGEKSYYSFKKEMLKN